MTAYTIIPDTSIDAESLTDVALMTALRDNPLAIVECATGAPRPTTQAVGDNSTKFATTAFCEAGFVNNDVGAGAVGSILFANHFTGSSIASGVTVAGSELYPLSNDASGNMSTGYGASALSGTWRNIGNFTCAAGALSTWATCTMFQRIS